MKNCISNIRTQLQDTYSESEIKELTYIILEFVTKKPLSFILANKNTNLSANEYTQVNDIIRRLKNNEPYQYIIGAQEFMGMSFKVTPDVLIPRDETAELVNLIIHNHSNTAPSIIDIGTGSGCIAIALKKQMSQSSVSALDISSKALEIAKENAQNNEVSLNFFCESILKESLDLHQKFDLIVSNPPYVRHCEKVDMHNRVLNFEPHLALFVDDDNPLIFYQAIAQFAEKHLNKNGYIYLEINEYLGKETAKIYQNLGYHTEIIKDFYNKNRMIIAHK